MNTKGKYEDMAGVILAGGRSKRMGFDKKYLTPNGEPQYRYLYNTMALVFDRVFISLSAQETYTGPEEIVRDQFNFSGPLNGMLSSLKTIRTKGIFFVAVDMPNITKEELLTLLSHRDQSLHATCYMNKETNHIEPLFSIWEQSSIEIITRSLTNNIYSPYQILAHHSVKRIETSNSKLFHNLNTPEDQNKF